MKKIFVLALVLFFVSTAVSLANTGAPVATDNGKSLYGGITAAPAATTGADVTLIGKLSKGVYASWSCDVLGYILTTQHQSGNRSFGSSHDATAIYRNDTTPVDASGAATPLTSGFFGAGWTAM
jgi:hypothetical protein